MTTNQLGIRNSNIIVPYTAATKRTKVIDLGAGDITSGTGTSNITGIVGDIVCYADSSNKWKAVINARLACDFVTGSSFRLTFPYLKFRNKSYFYQDILCYVDTAGWYTTDYGAYTNPNASVIDIAAASSITGATGAVYLTMHVSLEQEPTTYTTAANMEGVLPVSVYIPPASAGIAGLVNNVAGNTAGTPILGRTDGVAVASGYVGYTLSGLSSASIGTPSYTSVGSLTLTAGRWRVSVCVQNDGTASNTGFGAKVQAKGAGGTTFGVDYLIITYPSAGYGNLKFADIIVDIATGDANKTIAVTSQTSGAAAAIYANIVATIIA